MMMMHSMSPSLQRRLRPLVTIDGRDFDITNLYTEEALIVSQKGQRRQSRKVSSSSLPEISSLSFHDTKPRRKSKATISLYPSLEELAATPDITVDQCFRGAIRRRTPLVDPESLNDSNPSMEADPTVEDSNPNPTSPVVVMPSSQIYKSTTVEIMPGHFVELRGSDETWDALAIGNTQVVECTCCLITLEVIRDAIMVLCPECRMISPLDGIGEGLGLGVRTNKQARAIRLELQHHSSDTTFTAPADKSPWSSDEESPDNDDDPAVQFYHERRTR